MRELRASALFVALAALVAVPATAISSTRLQENPQLQLSEYQLIFMGQPVDQLVTGVKTKRYRISLTGAGFEPSSRVFLDGRKVATTYVSATQLIARLIPGLTPAAEEMPVQVVNPDGQQSDVLLIDVISDPATLSISNVSPDAGPAGTRVTITGTGFTATGNKIRFRIGAPPFTEGFAADVPSEDGKTISFSVSSALCPPCAFTVPPCLAPCLAGAPGDYKVSVTNANGISNSLRFLVSSTNGPVGVWGGDHIRVEVSDVQVRVTGLCFEGLIEQTLQLDATGSFDQAGQIFTFIGPAGLPRPARYSGSIAGNLMTLVITLTDSKSLLGPFILVFGNDVQVVHPCV
jgi:IPT/TIG domain